MQKEEEGVGVLQPMRGMNSKRPLSLRYSVGA